MKAISSKFCVVTVSFFMLFSCMQENFPEAEQTIMATTATISIGTRGGGDTSQEGDPADRAVSSLRVIAIDEYGIVKNNSFYLTDGITPIRHTMRVGTYRFFFLVNEPSCIFSAVDNIVTYNNLAAIAIPSSQFGPDTDIPMIFEVPQATILTENKVQVGSEAPTGDWIIKPVRLAVRVDIDLMSIYDFDNDFAGVEFSNLPDYVSLTGNYDKTPHSSVAPHKFLVSDANAGDHFADAAPPSGYAWAKKVMRIILPSNEFSPVDQPERAVVFTVLMNKTNPASYNPSCTIDMKHSDPQNHTMPRNHYFKISGNIDLRDVNVKSEDWTEAELYGNITTPYNRMLKITDTKVTLYDGSTARIYFWSNQSRVTLDDYSTTFPSGTVRLVYDPDKGSGYLDISSTLTTTTAAAGTIRLNTGELKRELTISTAFNVRPVWGSTYPYADTDADALKAMPTGSRMFVGTFHRWNQTGERIIDTDNNGPWSAEVEDPEGSGSFVMIDRMASPCMAVMFTNNPGDAEGCKLPADSPQKVVGDGHIYFRVGLRSTLASADATPRYARIIVKTSTGDYYIYVRQGEAPDYLMRPDDALTGSTDTPDRSKAAKFAVYNLTDPLKGGGSNLADNSLIAGGGALFVDYPSKAGYMFLGNLGLNPAMMRAFNPSNPSGVITGWITLAGSSAPWDVTRDVCPQGYRHPSDGLDLSTDNPTETEFRQSIFLNPKMRTLDDWSNSQFGFCADGWFDRRPLDASEYSVGSGSEVAYIGRLYFNPATSASIFFPAGGSRIGTNGSLSGTGVNGIYWTSTIGYPNVSFMSVKGRMNSQQSHNAAMVRCVRIN